MNMGASCFSFHHTYVNSLLTLYGVVRPNNDRLGHVMFLPRLMSDHVKTVPFLVVFCNSSILVLLDPLLILFKLNSI